MGFEVVGVSPDSEKSHRGFIEKQGLNFTLLSDPDKVVAKAYGVWGEKKFMGRTFMGILRTTFVIDEKGMIERVLDKVRTKDHFEQIVELINENVRDRRACPEPRKRRLPLRSAENGKEERRKAFAEAGGRSFDRNTDTQLNK